MSVANCIVLEGPITVRHSSRCLRLVALMSMAWAQLLQAQTAHSSLAGLNADDHKQYLLLDATRQSTLGFTVVGQRGTASSGARLTGKNALFAWCGWNSSIRAGYFSLADENGCGGISSAAFGENTKASSYGLAAGYNTKANGIASTALGLQTTAGGLYSTALGEGTTANGESSIAGGLKTIASGPFTLVVGEASTAAGRSSVAMGTNVTASGDYSIAMGVGATTNSNAGSLVWGDNTGSVTLQALQPNSVSMRASGGVRLRTRADLGTGCDLAPSSGSWNCTSSRATKTDFANVNAEMLLDRVRELPVQTWRYRGEIPTTRHMGPTAEDFRALFGLGTDSVTIGHIDLGGVSLAAAHALEERTRVMQTALEASNAEVARLRMELRDLKSEQRQLIDRLVRLERKK